MLTFTNFSSTVWLKKIVDAHPHLDLIKVHDALSYYYENRQRLDEEIAARRERILELKKKFPSKLGS